MDYSLSAMNPDLSIIIPVYNGQESIGACLDSVLFQDGANKFEIIVVNDGSNDNTEKIVQAYQNFNSNIHLHTQQNAGVSAARNAGIARATGEFITFIDADDMVGVAAHSIAKYFIASGTATSRIGNMRISRVRFTDMPQYSISFERQYFTKMLNAARKSSADVVMAGKITVNDDAKYFKAHMYDTNVAYGTAPMDKDILLKQADCRESANFALYGRRFLARNGLEFMKNVHLDEDILFCMQAVLFANNVTTVSDTAYLYRRHMNTLSNFLSKMQNDLKYSRANIQRFSVLLRDLARYPQYAHICTHWLKVFSSLGPYARDFQEHYPSGICTQCPYPTCDGCYIRDAMDEKIAQNIQKFIYNRQK